MRTLLWSRCLQVPSYTAALALTVAHSQVLMQLLARLWERNNTIPSASASHLPHHLPLRPIGK